MCKTKSVLLGVICLLATNVCADVQFFRVGVGGLYGSYSSDVGGYDFKNSGGYFGLMARGFSDTKSFIVEGGGDIIFGKNTNDQTNGTKAMSAYEGFLNLGYNVLPQDYPPLYLKAEYGYGSFKERVTDTTLLTGLHQIGAVLHGFIPTQGKLTYEYALGYYYIFHGYHYLMNTDSKNRASIETYSYALKAHIGFAYDFSEKLGAFMNLKVRYYDIAKSYPHSAFTYPQAYNLLGMLELGLQF